MSKVDKFWAEGSMSKDDMGETIFLIRESKKLSVEDFAKEVGCTERILISSEDGKGAHVYGTFMKVCNKYELETKMSVFEK